MDEYLKALLFAVAPALGNLGGGIVAEFVDVSKRMLSFALHAAAGVVLAVVAVKLIPQTLSVEPPWLPILAFVGGGVLFMGADALLERLSGGKQNAGPWVLWFGVAIDLFKRRHHDRNGFFDRPRARVAARARPDAGGHPGGVRCYRYFQGPRRS